jgi:hypothetical protein
VTTIRKSPEHTHELLKRAKAINNTRQQDDKYLVDHTISYLHWHALHTSNCPSLRQMIGHTNSCSCMSHFSERVLETDDDRASPLTRVTARFIVYFSKLHKTEQQKHVMGMFRMSQFIAKSGDHLTYEIPVLCDPEVGIELDEPIPYVCRSAMQLILGRKYRFFDRCIDAVKHNTIPEHGLRGNKNAVKVDDEVVDSLRTFFHEVEQYCDVVPTRFVREHTGETSTRDDTECLTLPPYWSKRSLYGRWCYD